MEIKQIPYGQSDFGEIRKSNMYYVDKTKYIELLEKSSRFVFWIRPRRFGKSLWLSTLQYYYDINDKDDFDMLFKDTYIHEHPTEERNTYLTLALNFSNVDPDIKRVEDSFQQYGKITLDSFFQRYRQYFDDKEELKAMSYHRLDQKLQALFVLIVQKSLKLYMFIDEYDNFANTIITAEGNEAYHKLTHGFFRFFFNVLKGATSMKGSGITKLFITGVSPITMDDVTSGMNIGKNLSRRNNFNELLGFTNDEVYQMLSYYHEQGCLPVDVDTCMNIFATWYNNYKFSEHAQQTIYNSDMILYFISETIEEFRLPDQMIDQNIRIDYSKLSHLMVIDKKLNGNFSKLKQIMEQGEISSMINPSFPLKDLAKTENFISLLYYFGLLSIDKYESGAPVLKIPNMAIKLLMYGYLRDAYQDVNIFRIETSEFSSLFREMAYHGEFKPFFEYLSNEIEKQTSIRDYISGEKMIQGFLLAYLSLTELYITQTEQDMNKGFSDLYLEPFRAKYPDLPYAYLIELKYLTRSSFTEDEFKKVVQEAKTQIQQYAESERVRNTLGDVVLKKLVIVYKGWELIHLEEVQDN